jgi:hypothetical protein
MPLLEQLIPGNRYLFHIKEEFAFMGKLFRANFVDTIHTTLRVCHYYIDESNNHNSMWTMPVDWIEKIETLDEIADFTILPEDVVICIDNFA